jgi:hypothetical protein
MWEEWGGTYGSGKRLATRLNGVCVAFFCTDFACACGNVCVWVGVVCLVLSLCAHASKCQNW